MTPFDVGPWVYVVYKDNLPCQLIRGTSEVVKLNLDNLPSGCAYMRVSPNVYVLEQAPAYDETQAILV